MGHPNKWHFEEDGQVRLWHQNTFEVWQFRKWYFALKYTTDGSRITHFYMEPRTYGILKNVRDPDALEDLEGLKQRTTEHGEPFPEHLMGRLTRMLTGISVLKPDFWLCILEGKAPPPTPVQRITLDSRAAIC